MEWEHSFRLLTQKTYQYVSPRDLLQHRDYLRSLRSLLGHGFLKLGFWRSAEDRASWEICHLEVHPQIFNIARAMCSLGGNTPHQYKTKMGWNACKKGNSSLWSHVDDLFLAWPHMQMVALLRSNCLNHSASANSRRLGAPTSVRPSRRLHFRGSGPRYRSRWWKAKANHTRVA